MRYDTLLDNLITAVTRTSNSGMFVHKKANVLQQLELAKVSDDEVYKQKTIMTAIDFIDRVTRTPFRSASWNRMGIVDETNSHI